MTTAVQVTVGDELFVQGSTEAFGAVRKVHAHELEVDIEGFGDTKLPAEAVVSVHDHKVVVDPARLPGHLRDAIAHAHDDESRYPPRGES
jgi:hypothetical protein